MRQIVKTQTGTGSSSAAVVNTHIAPAHFSVSCVVDGTVTDYNVDITFDNVLDPAITPTWHESTELNAESATAFANFLYPVAAFRVTIVAGDGSVTMTILQAGIAGN